MKYKIAMTIFKYDALVDSHRQAKQQLTHLLVNYDYFNQQVLDQIQQLTVGHTDYFDVQMWQELLTHQDDLITHFSHFLFFYQENIQVIEESMYQTLQDTAFTHTSKNTISFDTRYVFIQHWLEAFKPFGALNLPLVWQVFQQYPFQIFPLLIELPSHLLKAEYVEDFYLLSQQQHLDFAQHGVSPIQYLSRFYQEFPELLAQVPYRYHNTASIQLKKDLLSSLTHYPETISYDLQHFILSVYFSEQLNKSELYFAAIDCLKKCRDIEIPSHVILHLKNLLDQDDVWHLPLSAMRTLHGIGVQEEWFKAYLLSALDNPYGCDDVTPRSTAIELLLAWQEDGLYAANKVIKILKQATQTLDVESFSDFLPYISAHPQYSTYSHSLLWQYLEQLDQQAESERVMNFDFLDTFIRVSARLSWQVDQNQWQILSSALRSYLVYETDESRRKLFNLLMTDLKIEKTKIDELAHWCNQQDQLNLADDAEIEDIF